MKKVSREFGTNVLISMNVRKVGFHVKKISHAITILAVSAARVRLAMNSLKKDASTLMNVTVTFHVQATVFVRTTGVATSVIARLALTEVFVMI